MFKSFIIGVMMIPGIVLADNWTGPDKVDHALGGAFIGATVTAATGQAWKGCAAATAVGLAKEIADAQNRAKHTPSFKDFAVTAAAGCLAAKGTSLLVGPGVIVYRKEF